LWHFTGGILSKQEKISNKISKMQAAFAFPKASRPTPVAAPEEPEEVATTAKKSRIRSALGANWREDRTALVLLTAVCSTARMRERPRESHPLTRLRRERRMGKGVVQREVRRHVARGSKKSNIHKKVADLRDMMDHVINESEKAYAGTSMA
jgi:hypothetical protein